ncbi:MAG: L-lactate permease [Collinsella aerofaciens]
MPAVLICLLANGVPTPYGSIGIPTVSVADLVGLDPCTWRPFSWCSSRRFVVIPLLIVLVAGRVADDQGNVASVAERMHGVAGVALLSGVSFVGAALVVAMFVGPELAVVVGSIVSLALTAALAMRTEKSGHLDARFHMNIEAGEQLTLSRRFRPGRASF